MATLHLPVDELTGPHPNLDLAADYLELTAFFASTGTATPVRELAEAMEIAAERDDDLDEELSAASRVVDETVLRLEERQSVLGSSYPFELMGAGNSLAFREQELTEGMAACLLSLVLSHLRAVSEMLSDSVEPSEEEVRVLRGYFQYFATAALAAEVRGPSWSFGTPRPDGSGFLVKLREIWRVIRDGRVNPTAATPRAPQDAGVDVFAWGGQPDTLPGCLLAAAQVATGKNWRSKSIRNQLDNVFWNDWFSPHPTSQVVCYHIVPFALSREEFVRQVPILGNLLHRLRVPRRVDQAAVLACRGVQVEAFDRLPEAARWLEEYRQRG